MDATRKVPVLRRRGWVIAGAVVLAAGAGLVYHEVTAVPEYVSTVTFLAVAGSDPTAGPFVERRMGSAKDLATSAELAERVVSQTSYHMSIEQVQSEISGELNSGGVILMVTVTDPSPEKSLGIASAVADNLPALAGQMDSAGSLLVVLSVVAEPSLDPTPA